jgi:hypothetical protein
MLKYALLWVCIFTQSIFIFLEVLEMDPWPLKEKGWEALGEWYSLTNLADVASLPLTAIYLAQVASGATELTTSDTSDPEEESNATANLISIIVVQLLYLLMAAKILRLMKVDAKFSFLVAMVSYVATALIPFIVFFLTLVFCFSVVICVYDADVDRQDYLLLPKFISVFIQMFRNSIGDIGILELGKWDPAN